MGSPSIPAHPSPEPPAPPGPRERLRMSGTGSRGAGGTAATFGAAAVGVSRGDSLGGPAGAGACTAGGGAGAGASGGAGGAGGDRKSVVQGTRAELGVVAVSRYRPKRQCRTRRT